MQVTIHLCKDVAAGLRSPAEDCPEAAALQVELRRLGISIHPLHPGAADNELSTHYYCEVSSLSESTRIASALLQQPGVEGAYSKPPDKPPLL